MQTGIHSVSMTRNNVPDIRLSVKFKTGMKPCPLLKTFVLIKHGGTMPTPGSLRRKQNFTKKLDN